MKSPEFKIGQRILGLAHSPLVVAEIGINHEGDVEKAIRMVDDAHSAGCECVKFHQDIKMVVCRHCSDRANMELDPEYIAAMEEES